MFNPSFNGLNANVNLEYAELKADDHHKKEMIENAFLKILARSTPSSFYLN